MFCFVAVIYRRSLIASKTVMRDKQRDNLVQLIALALDFIFNPCHPIFNTIHSGIKARLYPRHCFRSFPALGQYLRGLLTQPLTHLALNAANLGYLRFMRVEFRHQ